MQSVVCQKNNKYTVYENGDVLGPSGKILKGFIHPKGYKHVFLGNGDCSKVHRLVAQAFIPNPDKKPEVNHKDGNKLNNHVDNLEWVTHTENIRHAVKTGLLVLGFGEDSVRAILNYEKVAYIRKHFIKRHKEFGLTGLGKKFGVTPTSIARVVYYKNWN